MGTRKGPQAVEAARQRGEDGPPRTVLAGLLAQCPDDPERVVVDLVGIAVGAVPTVTEAVVRVVDHLLDHPEAAKAVASCSQERLGRPGRSRRS